MKGVHLKKETVKTSVVLKQESVLDDACPICQVDIGSKSPEGVKETWALTPCGHAFGSVCLKRYLAMTNKPLCPICRQGVFHRCLHPVLPVLCNKAKEVVMSGPPANELHHSKCPYCIKKQRKLHRHMRRQSSRSNNSDGSNDTVDEEDMPLSKREKLADITRGILDRALHLTRIRRRPASHAHSADDSEDDDSEDAAAAPSQPPSPGHPPVPGPYGRWDLASNEPDWKFLSWYDAKEPKTKTTADDFR